MLESSIFVAYVTTHVNDRPTVVSCNGKDTGAKMSSRTLAQGKCHHSRLTGARLSRDVLVRQQRCSASGQRYRNQLPLSHSGYHEATGNNCSTLHRGISVIADKPRRIKAGQEASTSHRQQARLQFQIFSIEVHLIDIERCKLQQ